MPVALARLMLANEGSALTPDTPREDARHSWDGLGSSSNHRRSREASDGDRPLMRCFTARGEPKNRDRYVETTDRLTVLGDSELPDTIVVNGFWSARSALTGCIGPLHRTAPDPGDVQTKLPENSRKRNAREALAHELHSRFGFEKSLFPDQSVSDPLPRLTLAMKDLYDIWSMAVGQIKAAMPRALIDSVMAHQENLLARARSLKRQPGSADGQLSLNGVPTSYQIILRNLFTAYVNRVAEGGGTAIKGMRMCTWLRLCRDCGIWSVKKDATENRRQYTSLQLQDTYLRHCEETSPSSVTLHLYGFATALISLLPDLRGQADTYIGLTMAACDSVDVPISLDQDENSTTALPSATANSPVTQQFSKAQSKTCGSPPPVNSAPGIADRQVVRSNPAGSSFHRGSLGHLIHEELCEPGVQLLLCEFLGPLEKIFAKYACGGQRSSQDKHRMHIDISGWTRFAEDYQIISPRGRGLTSRWVTEQAFATARCRREDKKVLRDGFIEAILTVLFWHLHLSVCSIQSDAPAIEKAFFALS
ncbi:hypothetical protein FOZ61_011088 [Perkinsus olseni]|uniref:Uncharacterized protein n=1 Tax=Perkinsus olseni TaxID=32597 RepID=A0A7J6KUF5_PEROL|nr:hypothetical protein FOZ61_011088 [Perkinsus olseni]